MRNYVTNPLTKSATVWYCREAGCNRSFEDHIARNTHEDLDHFDPDKFN